MQVVEAPDVAERFPYRSRDPVAVHRHGLQSDDEKFQSLGKFTALRELEAAAISYGEFEQ
jgi:hypothetical protein